METGTLSSKGLTRQERLIVALDTPCLDVTRNLLRSLDGLISFYKVGLELFSAHGWEAVKLVKRTGARVFLDLKLHDIPNTVSKTVAVLCEHEVDMVTLHTLGGAVMMRMAREIVDQRVQTGRHRPMLMGVTILTSHSEEDIREDLAMNRGIHDQVLHLADLAKQSGLNGVISSPHEASALRKQLPEEFLIVTPGVRPAGSDRGDQKRVFTPEKAFEAGADFLVIGRPITAADHPRQQAEGIISALS